jgi:hypothetical protein
MLHYNEDRKLHNLSLLSEEDVVTLFAFYETPEPDQKTIEEWW